MGYLNISEIFGVPKGKVERYVEKPIDYENLIKVALGKHPTLPRLVDELVKFLIEMDRRYHGLQRAVSHYVIGRLFEKAYNNAATMDVSVRGFETTDLIPINRNVYADADFAAEAPRCHISPSSKISTSSTPQPTVADSNLHILSQDI
ncbi:hypothetical protein ILUMI_08061 [Ignelater luminosus]|uniref:Uncharacterized protein n=1 Tax=Ignelater luminosus TaxID=2038154 RepID=A0A8K0D2N5_IGNLU|nr:hypothetical protein ILUMI_08061 [Ignelater luminosus]